MSDHRKPTEHLPTGHADKARSKDSRGSDTESTTVRLKSIRLRRREQELTEAHRLEAERQADEKKRAAMDKIGGSTGRVRHDERGMAVWDWSVETAEFETLSATGALKKLDVGDLKIEETAKMGGLSLEKPSRDKGGGFNPYDQRDTAKKKPVLDQLTGNKDKKK